MKSEDFPLTFAHEDLTYVNRSAADLLSIKVPESVILPALAGRLKSAVDDKAEALRLSAVTGGSGQAMEYQEAQTQAFAVLADPKDASAEKYPMLAATIGFDIDPDTKAPATDVVGVARSVVAAYTAWVGFGSAIKSARIKGKAAIDKAGSIADAAAAFEAIEWPGAA